jgi:multiple sugar transport system substrate-binding protein
MKEIEFSSMNLVLEKKAKCDLLEAFTARHEIKAKLHQINWPDAWNELVCYGLNSYGPDVSEIGTTWVTGLHSIDALRPFTEGEVALLGGEAAFQPSTWQACHLGKDALAIPFVLDVRIVLYRRDWLQKAGVDEATAFSDADHFANTLRSIKAAGHPSPLGIATSRSVTRLIHDMSSWVWSAGGEIRSNDGRRMLLLEPESRAGMQAYFELNEFISPETEELLEIDAHNVFASGKCAVGILSERSYLWLTQNNANQNPEVTENLGVAMLLQTPFIGGSGLGIWRHTPHHKEALKLIQYLTSAEAWQTLYPHLPQIPARLDALAQSPFAATPCYPIIQKSLKNGRSFQNVYRWSGVESRLAAVMQGLWDDLRVNRELNIAHEIEQRFGQVCDRLEKTILIP